MSSSVSVSSSAIGGSFDFGYAAAWGVELAGDFSGDVS
jgi:hypothetical protein